MKAAIATGINADDPISMIAMHDDWPEPVIAPGHARIRMAATTINAHDLWALRGVGVRPDAFPMTLGCDIVGWDDEGNEVIVSGCFADPDDGDGDETLSPSRSLISEDLPGSFAEFTVAPRRNLLPKPAWLSWQQAACLNVAYGTTFRMLFTRAQARPGERVLVQGAGGGVAIAAIQMARAAGLWVVATSRTEAKRQRALELGAHEVVPTGARLAEPVDLVVDTVGEATWAHSLKCLRPGGRIVTAGATTGPNPGADLTRLFYRQLSVIGSTSVTRGEFIRLLNFLHATGIRPVIDSEYPFAELPAAMARSEAPDLFGKVVVGFGA